jgi:hypothetical protein
MGNKGAPKQDIKRLMQDVALYDLFFYSFVNILIHIFPSSLFTQELWEEQLVSFIAVSQLPFQLVEHPQFRSLIKLAQLAPTCPEIPSAKTMRRRLQSTLKERQQNILRGLPDRAKLSIALDCWTSPFQQAFLAISGYFLDKDWEYRETSLASNRFMEPTLVPTLVQVFSTSFNNIKSKRDYCSDSMYCPCDSTQPQPTPRQDESHSEE